MSVVLSGLSLALRMLLGALAILALAASADAQGSVAKPPKGMVAANAEYFDWRTGQRGVVPAIQPERGGSYAGVYAFSGQLMARNDWNAFDFLDARRFTARHLISRKLWVFDRRTGKGWETSYAMLEPISEASPSQEKSGDAVFVASDGFYERRTSGPRPDEASDIFLLDGDFNEIAAIYNVGGDTNGGKRGRQNDRLTSVIGYGERLLVQYEAPDGSALSRIYNRRGQPLGPELPRVLLTFGPARAGERAPMTVVLQSAPMSHPAMFRNMLWRPMKQDGSGLVDLPTGALGMFPVKQTRIDLSVNLVKGGNPDDHVFVPEDVQGWGVVFVQDGAPTFVVSPTGAEETASLATTLPRYADLILTQVYGGRLAFAVREAAGGPWRALDTATLQPIGAPGGDIIAGLDQIEREADEAKAAAIRKANEDLSARQEVAAEREAARAAVLAAAQAEAQQRDTEQRADYLRRYDLAMKGRRMDLARAAAWALGDCGRYRAAWQDWLIPASMPELEQGRTCGISEASITTAGGAALEQLRQDGARQQALDDFRDAVQAFGRAVDRGVSQTDPNVTVRIYEGGGVRQEVMPQSHYDTIYGGG